MCVLCSSDFVSGSQNDTITTVRLFHLLGFAATVTGRHNYSILWVLILKHRPTSLNKH